MPLATSPSTPEQPPAPRLGLGRSATLPSKFLAGSARRSSEPASPGPSDCETLFVHPTVKVVKFDAKPTGASRPSLSPGRGDARNDVGTLPWTTPTEMTVAAGKFAYGVDLQVLWSRLTRVRAALHLSRPELRCYGLLSEVRQSASPYSRARAMLVCRWKQ